VRCCDSHLHHCALCQGTALGLQLGSSHHQVVAQSADLGEHDTATLRHERAHVMETQLQLRRVFHWLGQHL
jgi:hypothetical protein